MSKASSILFEARTPLGFTVRVTRAYWTLITTVKHPSMAGCEAEVKTTLESPVKFGVAKAMLTYIFSIAAGEPGVGFVP